MKLENEILLFAATFGCVYHAGSALQLVSGGRPDVFWAAVHAMGFAVCGIVYLTVGRE